MRKFFSLVWLLAAFTVLGSDLPPGRMPEAGSIKKPKDKIIGFLLLDSKLRLLLSERLILDMRRIPAGS